MSDSDLPRGWEQARLDEVAMLVFGQSPPSSTYNTQGIGLPFFQGKAEFGPLHPTPNKWCTEPTRIAEAGDVLISVRAPVGPTNVADTRCAIGRGLAAIRTHISKDYIRYWLFRSKDELASKGTGTTFSAITKNVLKSHLIPVAPLTEQHRIVEKIETLFARIDKGEEALREVQKLLKRYRQSILKAAVTGELTRDWREANQHKLEPASDLLTRILETRRENWEGRGKYKEPPKPDIQDLPELPANWAWASLAQLTYLKGGITVDRKRTPKAPITLPYLRVANVQNGFLDLSEVKEITVDQEKAKQCLLMAGDILLNEGGDLDKLGRGWVWNEEINPCIHQNHVFRARPVLTDLASEYISHYANAFGQQFFMDKGKQSVNLASISLTAISGLPVPLPPVTEQKRILSEIKIRLKQITQLESACEVELTRTSSLRQSILKSAFTGQLVPQDPNDEPASELLARIRAEREATPKAKPRRKARA